MSQPLIREGEMESAWETIQTISQSQSKLSEALSKLAQAFGEQGKMIKAQAEEIAKLKGEMPDE